GLIANALLIVAIMSAIGSTLTLPGIAGLILTIGMAVDANVLIYERIREELRLGQDLKTAVRLGYDRAMSSIVDGNVTNLIVCFVLAYTGTQEIKGFAITLGIGVVATMFCALVITRIIFTLFMDRLKVKRLSMLPMVIPVLERMLEPRINWLRLRGVFITVSAAFIALGVGMIVTQGQRMLDTEFRGGIQIDLPLKLDESGEPIVRTRQEIQEAIQELGEVVEEDSPLRPLRSAEVMPLNPQSDGVTSDFFRIKTFATNTEQVQAAVFSLFGAEGQDIIDSRAPLRFNGQQAENAENAPVFAIDNRRLGDAIGRGEFRDDVREYLGGVAILLENLTPAPTLESLEDRLEAMRSREGFSQTLGRLREIRVLEGTSSAVQTAVVLVSDEDVSVFDNEQIWNADVRDLEWRLTRDALTQTTSLASVQSFSSIVAQDFKGKAIVSVFLSLLLILIYIWVRFGNVRYSVAAILTLTHDVLIVIGLIALAEIVYDHPSLQPIAAKLLIEPFKIDLNLVAAMLTIIGYSLNDTIIIMDRIRENRGKLPYATREVINSSINQTISRTIVTSGTTLIAVGILYFTGGPGVHGFSYALLIGVVVGTYSSIAIASPLVWSRKHSHAEPIEDGSDIV
ncbi:MAG: protein translocase subunit SecF, partial [Phycisphaerales bacterium JB059]